jgi:peptidoglycan/LPS O-acetylase OafA/YrhL
VIASIVSSAWLLDQPAPIDMRPVLGPALISLALCAVLAGSHLSESRLLRGDWVVRLGKVS